MKPITVGVRFLFDSEGNNNWGVIMAGTTFVVLPLLIVYVFAQRFIIDGLTAGATKG
jgi:sn-glycerol 3-phosphate transport system permease protein